MASNTTRARPLPAPKASSSEPARRTRKRGRLNRRLGLTGLLFVLPASLYIVAFHIYPVAFGLYLSFTDYSPLSRSAPAWQGLGNYREILTDGEFLDSLLVTGRYVIQVLPAAVIIALFLALLLNKPIKGIGLFRSAIYIPHIVSLTVVSMVWLWMYSQQGMFNQILELFGGDGGRWLLDEDSALTAVSVMRVWKALGGNTVLLLAGLQSIPRELYEAAKMDGAGFWNQLRYVTLPGLKPMMIYVVAINVIFLAQSFAEIFLLTQGGPLQTTTTTNYLIYTEAFQYNQMGNASAMAFVLFAFIAGLSVLAVRGVMGKQR